MKKLEMDQETSKFCRKAKDSSVAPSRSPDGSKLQLLTHGPTARFDKNLLVTFSRICYTEIDRKSVV